MTTMAWRIVQSFAGPNVPTVVTTLAVTAVTASVAAVWSACQTKRRVNVLRNNAECRREAARWLNSPQGQKWVALKSERRRNGMG
jgi:hypothetical protein